MSALGHKRTFAPQWAMSALPPKADMCGAKRKVRYVPKADIGLTPPESISPCPCSEPRGRQMRRREAVNLSRLWHLSIYCPNSYEVERL
jgi:hypothetical protein